MEKKIELSSKIHEILSVWRNCGILPQEAMRYILYIIATRKVLDDLDSFIIADLKDLFLIQKYFYTFGSETMDFNVFYGMGKVLEDNFNLPEGLFNSMFDARTNENNWQHALMDTRRLISSFEYYAHKDLHILAQKPILSLTESRGQAKEIFTNAVVCDLFNLILKVKDDETFCDGTIGYGISAIDCVAGTNASIWGMDIDFSTLQIAALYSIIAERKKITLLQGDFTMQQPEQKFDKIGMELPFVMRNQKRALVNRQLFLADKWLQTAESSEIDWLFVAQSLELLEEGGRAALLVPASFLFKTGRARNFKKKLVEDEWLKAVISLPKIYATTAVNTAIIVLEKGSKQTMVIDLDDNSQDFFLRERKGVMTVTMLESGKQRLDEILSGQEEVIGLSRIISSDEIEEKDYDLSPSVYVKVLERKEYESIESINEKLEKCYGLFQEITEENKKLGIFN